MKYYCSNKIQSVTTASHKALQNYSSSQLLWATDTYTSCNALDLSTKQSQWRLLPKSVLMM